MLLQVMTSSETGSIPRVDFSQSFDFEHQVLRDFGAASQLTSDDESSTLEKQRYTQLGHEQEAVAMALIAVTASEDRDSQVLQFMHDEAGVAAPILNHIWHSVAALSLTSFVG